MYTTSSSNSNRINLAQIGTNSVEETNEKEPHNHPEGTTCDAELTK